jgi:hypothetical protein
MRWSSGPFAELVESPTVPWRHARKTEGEGYPPRKRVRGAGPAAGRAVRQVSRLTRAHAREACCATADRFRESRGPTA